MRATDREEGQGAGPGWRDDPIQTLGEDRLGRAPFAQHAARLIHENHSAESSVVYGLEGPWGSGKSSVIALLTSHLAQHAQWHVVTFTPWATTGTDGMLAEFFAALSTVAPKTQGAHRLHDRISSYADIARPIAAVIPVLGAGLAEASRTVEERLRKPWSVAFVEVADELRSIGRPVLVVVDDIDRLQPAELLDLLRVVRLLGRFPGVDFLLAYDEQTLVETLQDPGRGRVSTARARTFMEKIVQYPLSMPPLLTGKIVKMLNEGLTEIVTPERAEGGFEKNRFGRIILNTMPSQLTTPRAIDRFLAQVRQQFRIHDLDEINDVDLILATFLRVQFPDLFAQLQRWKAQLTRARTNMYGFSRREDAGPDWDKLLSCVEGEENRKDAQAVMQTLFPAMTGAGAAEASAGRFAHPDYFDRYLAQEIPEGDIPDAVVAHALIRAAAGDQEELSELLLAEDDEQVTLALSKIRSRYPDIAEPWTRGSTPEGPVTVQLLSVGMEIIDKMDDRIASWTSALSQATYWMANVLRLLLEHAPDADIDPALATCKTTQRRAHVVSAAAKSLDNVPPPTQRALKAALRREAERILPLLLGDLRQGDASEGEAGNSFLYGLVEQAELLPELQGEIRTGLEAGAFTLQDVAARFVNFAYLVGGPQRPSSASFSGDLFTRVTGVVAESVEFDERGEWDDISWTRRREFASRFLNTMPQDEP